MRSTSDPEGNYGTKDMFVKRVVKGGGWGRLHRIKYRVQV